MASIGNIYHTVSKEEFKSILENYTQSEYIYRLYYVKNSNNDEWVLESRLVSCFSSEESDKILLVERSIFELPKLENKFRKTERVERERYSQVEEFVKEIPFAIWLENKKFKLIRPRKLKDRLKNLYK